MKNNSRHEIVNAVATREYSEQYLPRKKYRNLFYVVVVAVLFIFSLENLS